MTAFNPILSIHRHAIWTVHREECYICKEPLPFKELEIDHVIPKFLKENPAELAEVKKQFGLQDAFDIDGFENLLPSCRKCNQRKGSKPWKPSPLIQMTLDNASDKAADVLRVIDKTLKTKNVEKALIALQALHESGELTPEDKELLGSFLEYQDSIRVPDMRRKPVQVTKQIKVHLQLEPLITEKYSAELLKQVKLFFGSDGKAIKSPAVCLYCKRKTFHGEKCPGCGRLN